jgi:hypothetical protein
MVMPDVVDAVSGEEVENATAIRGVQFSTHAARVSHIHLKQIKKPHPLRIDVISVTGGGFHRCCRHRDLGQKKASSEKPYNSEVSEYGKRDNHRISLK